MKCPLCETVVTETDVVCSGCDEMLSEWRILNGNSELLRQRGLQLAGANDLVGACLAFLQAALGDPTDNVSLVDAGRSLILLNRADDAGRILQYAHQRSRNSGARELMDLLKQLTSDADESDADAPDSGKSTANGHKGASQTTRSASTNGAPLLGLELICHRKKFLGKDVDPLWLSVVHTERNWQDGWNSLEGWVATACDVEHPHPALLYLKGINAWVSDEPRQSLAHFSRCLMQEPTVLNSVAWSLYATLVMGGSLDGCADMAVEHVGVKGLRISRDALAERLQTINSEQSRDALRTLRNVEP